MSIETDDQVLWGLTEIAAAINRNEAQTLSLIWRNIWMSEKSGTRSSPRGAG